MFDTKNVGMRLFALVLISGLFLTGCSEEVSSISHAKEIETASVEEDSYSLVGAYDSADTAVIGCVDENAGQITLTNLRNRRDYVLHYSGTSYMLDKYGSAMTAGQLKQGQIVDVTFLKSNRQINTLQVSSEAWKYDEVEKYDLTGVNGTASIGSAVYSLATDTPVYSNGQQVDLMDIVKGDILTISGMGHEICSINVDKGHGYVRLKNDYGLVGGWIEIGNKVITRVSSENMLLAVPEGSYTVKMYNDYSSVTKDILVERNQELILDCSDVKMNEEKTGFVRFHLSPESAEVRVDGQIVNSLAPVELSYGIHQVSVAADGYQTLSKYLSVGAGYAEVSILLEKETEDSHSYKDDPIEPSETESQTTQIKDPFASDEIGLPETPSVSGNSNNKSSVSDNSVISATTANKVYVDAPEKVEVFVDGVYQGLTPMSFKKATGSHTITLRKSGYVTRTYTVYLYDDGQDITYSFSELEKENGDEKKEEIDTGNINKEKTPAIEKEKEPEIHKEKEPETKKDEESEIVKEDAVTEDKKELSSEGSVEKKTEPEQTQESEQIKDQTTVEGDLSATEDAENTAKKPD